MGGGRAEAESEGGDNNYDDVVVCSLLSTEAATVGLSEGWEGIQKRGGGGVPPVSPREAKRIHVAPRHHLCCFL